MTELFKRSSYDVGDANHTIRPEIRRLTLDQKSRKIFEDHRTDKLAADLGFHFGSELLRMLWPTYLPQGKGVPSVEQIFMFYNMAQNMGEKLHVQSVLVSPPVLSPHKLEYVQDVGKLTDMGFLHPDVEYIKRVRQELKEKGDQKYLDIPKDIRGLRHELLVFENTIDFYARR